MIVKSIYHAWWLFQKITIMSNGSPCDMVRVWTIIYAIFLSKFPRLCDEIYYVSIFDYVEMLLRLVVTNHDWCLKLFYM